MICYCRLRSQSLLVLSWLILIATSIWGKCLTFTDNMSFLSEKRITLPLTVLSFSSSMIDKSIELTCLVKILDPINSSVAIQRSEDGNHFETLEMIKGILIDSVTFEFCYRDENVVKSYYFYRLKYHVDENLAYYTESVKVNASQAKYYILEPNTLKAFNPSTTIRFEIKNKNKVNLKIYNMLGQNICTLIDSHLKPGRYEMDWNGKDDFGREVAGGLYFYQILIDRYSETRRIALLR